MNGMMKNSLKPLYGFLWIVGFSLALVACHPNAPKMPAIGAGTGSISCAAVERLQHEAKLLAPEMTSELGRRFLAASASLTAPAPRVLYSNTKTQRFFSEDAAARLPEAERRSLVKASYSEMAEFYYFTYHGSPLAYARAIDLLGAAGVEPSKGQSLADFGFGNIGQLRLLASLGFKTIGIDVAPFLGELYSYPGDQGPYGPGRVNIVIGEFPEDTATVEALSGKLDVFLSKNTLKRGYIHPYRTPAKPEWVIHLGVTDEVFLNAIYKALKPGGKFMIYNICPALTPPDKPFVTWSDGRSPFSREQFAKAGFSVIAFDKDDTDFVRRMGRLLGWDSGPDAMDLDNDLSVLYTLVQKNTGTR